MPRTGSTAESQPAHRLRPLTDVFGYHGSLADDVPTGRPWRLGSWLWATQGHVLVALVDDGSPADETPEKMRKADRYLHETPLDLAPTSYRALRAFAGPVAAKDASCERCCGSGYEDGSELIECEHCHLSTRQPCGECGGDGLAGLEVRYARIYGTPVNLFLLAFALSAVPACETVTIGHLASMKSAEYVALAVIGEGWRIVLMSVRESSNTVNVPVFALEPPRTVGAVDPVGGGSTP